MVWPFMDPPLVPALPLSPPPHAATTTASVVASAPAIATPPPRWMPLMTAAPPCAGIASRTAALPPGPGARRPSPRLRAGAAPARRLDQAQLAHPRRNDVTQH